LYSRKRRGQKNELRLKEGDNIQPIDNSEATGPVWIVCQSPDLGKSYIRYQFERLNAYRS
jgi:hypothetical protein